jgi:hypothetical protein
MLDRVDVPFLMGVMLGIISVGMIVWPRAMLEVSQDADGNPMRVTPGNAVWMRIAGVAVFALAVTLIVVGLVGAPGAAPPAQF